MRSQQPLPDLVGPLWWQALGAGYLRSLARRGRRPRTFKAYHTPLQDFGRWLERSDIKTIGDLDRLHVEAWQDDSHRLATSTQRLAGVVIRNALKWAAEEELPLSTPMLWSKVIPRRTLNRKPRPIPVRDLAAICARLESWTECNPTLLQLRTRALFWAIFSSGARITEALSLTRTSVVDGTALIEQKGGSEHMLVFNAKACAAMEDYLRARTDSAPAMFVSYRDLRPLSPLGYEEAQAGWDALCREAGCQRFTSHRIRHSTATELLRQHVDALVIARHLGHRDLKAIAGYAEVDVDVRREAMLGLDSRIRRAS